MNFKMMNLNSVATFCYHNIHILVFYVIENVTDHSKNTNLEILCMIYVKITMCTKPRYMNKWNNLITLHSIYYYCYNVTIAIAFHKIFFLRISPLEILYIRYVKYTIGSKPRNVNNSKKPITIYIICCYYYNHITAKNHLKIIHTEIIHIINIKSTTDNKPGKNKRKKRNTIYTTYYYYYCLRM